MLYPGTIRFEQMYDTLVAGMLAEPDRRSHAIKSYGEQFGAPKGDFSDFSQYSKAMVHYMEQDVKIGHKVYQYVSSRVTSCRAPDGTQSPVDAVPDGASWLPARRRSGASWKQSCVARCLTSSTDSSRSSGHSVPKKGSWDWTECRWASVDVITLKADNKRYAYTKGAAFAPIKPEMFNPGSRAQIGRRLMASTPSGGRPSGLTLVSLRSTKRHWAALSILKHAYAPLPDCR